MDMKISFSVRDRQRSVILTCRARSETAALVARRWPEYPTRVIPPSRYLWQLMVLCTLGALAGCASTKVQPSVMIPASDTLPRPTRIAVYDFAVAAHDVSPNNAPLSRLRRVLGGSQSEEELKVGRSVAGALSVELVKALKDLDLPIERASAAAVGDGTLAIEGQFVSIDEGNRLRRVVIGFGAGASEVKTHTPGHERRAPPRGGVRDRRRQLEEARRRRRHGRGSRDRRRHRRVHGRAGRPAGGHGAEGHRGGRREADRGAARQADQGDFRRAWMERGHARKVVGLERASLRPTRASQCRGDMT